MLSIDVKDETLLASQTFSGGTVTSAHNRNTMYGYSIQINVSDATPAAFTFVDANVGVVANTITKANHGCSTGLKVAATTTGTLPGGLSATNYWLIVVDASTLQLAVSKAAAFAGTVIDITSAAGGGTHTLTPAALSQLDLHVQASNDNALWVDIAGSTVSSAASTMQSYANVFYPYHRVLATMTTGQITTSVVTHSVGFS